MACGTHRKLFGREMLPRCVVVIALALGLLGCGQGALEECERSKASWQVAARAQQEKIQKLESEVEALRQIRDGDQVRYAEALAAVKAGHWDDGGRLLSDFIDLYPLSPLLPHARQALESLTAEIEQRRREEKKACEEVLGRIRKVDMVVAVELLDALLQKFPAAMCAVEAESKRAELASKAAAAISLKRNLQELGISIADMKSFWAVTKASDGKEMIVPRVSFKVKNVGSTPIDRLQIKGVFELRGKKEVLGTGTAYAVGYGDHPLKPGYSKEVFFNCDTGYSGVSAILSRPDVSVDVYADDKFVWTAHVADELRF